jgi:hypothetical protein
MSSNTQHNTNTTSTGNTGKLALILIFSLASIRQAPGFRTTERYGTKSGTNTERPAGYDSSPLAYDQPEGLGTTTAQRDSSRFGEGVPKQHHGHGISTGVGHHTSHQESKLHFASYSKFSIYICYTGTHLGQDTGTGKCFPSLSLFS